MLTQIGFKPGVVKDETPLASKPGFVDSDKVRFWRGRPQSIGGWQPLTVTPFEGIARGAHDWADLNGKAYLAWGTATRLYVMTGGSVSDITPPHAEGVLTQPFSTTLGSAVVVVNHPAHGLAEDDTVTLTNATPIAGLTIAGTHRIARVTPNAYAILASRTEVATATMTSGSTATVDYVSNLPVGLVDAVATGFGAGGYGLGPYGGLGGTRSEPRIWSFDNFGENLLANPRGYGLFEWQPAYGITDAVLNGAFNSTASWVRGTGWAIADGVAGKTSGTASDLSQAIATRLVPGKTYRLTFTVTVAAGTLRFRLNAGRPTPAPVLVGDASTPITQSGTYSRIFRAPIDMADIVFAADADFSGSLDDVSILQEAKAYRIKEAPPNIDYIFVDPARIVVALATQEADGDFNPLLIRWSDQEDVRAWAPAADSASGEIAAAAGGRVLAGLSTRKQNLVWTDSSISSLTFTGTNDVFSLDLLGSGCGLIGRQAAIDLNGVAFWMGRGSFYAFQGAGPQRLDCPIERDVFDHLDEFQAEKIYAGVNAEFAEVWWLYPDTRDGPECSRAVVFNTAEQTWWTHRFDRSCWLSGDNFPRPVAFSTDGYVYEHERGFDGGGAPIGWSLTTSAFDVEDGENLMMVKAIVPDFEDQQGDIDLGLTARLYPNAVDFNPWSGVAQPDTQILRMRRKGRQFAMTLSSGSNPSFFRMGALRLDVEKAGAKR